MAKPAARESCEEKEVEYMDRMEGSGTAAWLVFRESNHGTVDGAGIHRVVHLLRYLTKVAVFT